MEDLKEHPHLYNDIMAKIKSLRRTKKSQEEKLTEKTKHILDIEGVTEYNVWVRLPDKDDEDLSDVDIDGQAE